MTSTVDRVSLPMSSDGQPTLEDLEREVRQLRAALESRAVIGQAMGILMARLDIDADAAFAYLRRRSMHENRKLIDIATEIVRHRRRPARPWTVVVRDEVDAEGPLDPTDHDG